MRATIRIASRDVPGHVGHGVGGRAGRDAGPCDRLRVDDRGGRLRVAASVLYELTGPAPTTPRERAAAIGAALGEPVRFVEQTRQEAREQMLAFMPEAVVEGTLAILGEPLPAERRVGPDIERVLGRAPRPFAAWAARSTVAFR
jgi:hypothetical protein